MHIKATTVLAACLIFGALLAAAGASTQGAEATAFILPPNAIQCGAPAPILEGYDLVGVHETGLRHPDIPPDVRVYTFTLAEWECMYPPAPPELRPDVGRISTSDPIFGGAHATHPPHANGDELVASWHTPSAPSAGSANGYLKVIILLPNQDDPYYPADTCNWHDVGDAMIALTSEVGNGATYERWCYHDAGFRTFGNTDSYYVIDNLHSIVTYYHSWMVDQPNEIVIGYVRLMDHNGIAYQGDRFSVTAEDRATCCSWWEDSVTLHELGHNFRATHYPDEDRKDNCFYLYSVMNYCGLPNHTMVFDSGNRGTVSTQYWS